MWAYYLGAGLLILGYAGYKTWQAWRNYHTVIQVLEDQAGIEEWQKHPKDEDQQKVG